MSSSLRFTPPPPSRIAPHATTRLVVVSGLSGSGKTVALRMLEDLDYYCVDNLPVELMPAFVDSVTEGQPGRYPRLAVGVDVRNRPEDLSRLPEILSRLATNGIEYELVFLDTRDDVLFKRFSDTRRRHPLTGDDLSLADAIALERRLLRPLVTIADRVIDSSDLNVHQLRRLMITEFGTSSAELSLLFESFAYKRGVPADADFVFDARCLPNPHWIAELRPLSGRDSAIRDYFARSPEVEAYFRDVQGLLANWIPRFEAEQRNYVTIGIGCTGGRHRSVYLAERLAEAFRGSREQVLTFHRELE
ncbi:MAG TPA: RNase adapter RapZ [Candidatus Saccharimonadia bacterium]|nr:RNase adapter RapZ [Candidatus Saccharimonadia bacterium]